MQRKRRRRRDQSGDNDVVQPALMQKPFAGLEVVAVDEHRQRDAAQRAQERKHDNPRPSAGRKIKFPGKHRRALLERSTMEEAHQEIVNDPSNTRTEVVEDPA